MEDKLALKESHAWNLSDFIERRKDWNHEDETRLAEYLQQLSNKITLGAKNTLSELDDLIAIVDDTAIQVANINNEFQLLADKQFIENKVQEEDETIQNKIEKFNEHKTSNADVLVNNLKEALKNSLQAIDTHFEKVTVVVSDSDDDDDELKHKETILRPRIFYKKLNLPALSSNTQSEIAVGDTMSSDSDNDVEQSTYKFKNEVSLYSNDVPEENIHYDSESKIKHEPNSQLTDANMFEPENPKLQYIPTYTDNVEDDLFSPPPLPNDNDEDINNEYSMFGNDSNNMYGERNLWEDNDDDDDDFSNEPSLPIHSDEPPQRVIKSNIQEKIEVPSIQKSLNDELRKRFQKDDISSSSDNVKIKLPKGAVNILGGTDIKSYITSPVQNIKETTTSQINKNIAETAQKNNIDKDFNSKKLIDDSIQNPVISAHEDLIKTYSEPIKRPSLFEQNSDDEDLFAVKSSINVSVSKPDILISKENMFKNIKPSRAIFSESDSDDEFMNSKPTSKETTAHSIIDSNSTRVVDSSSDDDLFNTKYTKNKSTTKSTFIKENNVPSKTNFNEQKNNSENSDNVMNNKVGILSSPSNSFSNRNIMESSSVNDHIIQSNQKSSVFEHKKKMSNLFSSDEDDLDDNIFFNNKKDQTSNSTKLFQNTNDERSKLKVEIFDSSSDDDIFNTNKSNNNLNNSELFYTKEVQNTEVKTIIDNVIIDQAQRNENKDKINATGKNIIDRTNTNSFSLLSDNDEEDDDYLFFNQNVEQSRLNICNTQINEDIKVVSTSGEMLNAQEETKDKDISPENLLVSTDNNMFDEDTSNNKVSPVSRENIQNNKLSIFSNSDDEQQLDLDMNIQTENNKEKTKIIHTTPNLLSENVINNKRKESSDTKVIDPTIGFQNEILFTSTENTNNENKSSIFSRSDDEQKSSISSSIQNKNLKNTQAIHKIDSIDGSSFSSPNSNSDTPKKNPGKLSKNAGAFINIAGLLPKSKSSLKISSISQPVSQDEKDDDKLPTVGEKLFSAEKERARIQVKRRPQSRKARLNAARMSFVDIDRHSNFQESSRLFGSTSDLTDYKSSSNLNDHVIDSTNEVQSKIQNPISNKSTVPFDDKLYKSDETTETNNKIKTNSGLNLFDDDSDPFESFQDETSKKVCHSDGKEKLLSDKEQLDFNLAHDQFLEIKSVSEKQPDVEEQSKTELKDEKLKVELAYEEIEPMCDTIFKELDVKKLEEKKSTSTSAITKSSKKSNSLFDKANDDLFSPNSMKVNKPSSNIFDSDDEFEFEQPICRKSLGKSKLIFSDDSDDDDLFSSSSKPLETNLTFQKPIVEKSNQQLNRPSGNGYIQLTAESVAVNPLESKMN